MRIVAGRWRGRRLTAPTGQDVRPTTDRVREAWMSAMGGTFAGQRVLDLFAGSGALGLECLSRGATHCTFVERSSAALRTMAANIARLDAGALTTVVRGDALAFAARAEPLAYDLALADPPYGRGLAEALVVQFRRHPFARELWVEHRSDEAMPAYDGLRARRYGDTTLSCVTAESFQP